MAGRTREQIQERTDERKALAATVLPAAAVELAERRGTIAQADVLDELFELFKPVIAEQLPGMIDADAAERTLAEHEAIYDALAAGDPALAQAAALMHVSTTERWLRAHLTPDAPEAPDKGLVTNAG